MPHLTRRLATTAFLSVAALAAPWAAVAQTAWPSQPVRLIVPFSAGVSDTIARLVSTEMSKALGQPIVVENRAGAGGTIGSEACARALPDGSTFCLGTISSHAINPAITPKMPYDVAKDFAPVTQLASQPNAIAVANDFPARSIPELVATLKKRKPGDVAFGTSGVGTSVHLAGALFMQMTGTEIEHVPYRGSGQVTTALMTGELPMAFDNLSSVLPFAREGKFRLLGVTSAQRSQAAPEIPAVAEAVPGFESLSWHGFFAPAKVPAPIIARLHREAVAALGSPGVAARFEELGIASVGNSPEEFGRFVAAEGARWGEVARRANIRLD
jgi:tripartite-type tricarboxylate transporter receptor subunit TctC